ncbi:GntR family transcriptional regulator [Asanoa ishikariensis]|uniref:DNA-binding transcriptional regulator, FadR family n=1 Tax=Asanoa ishikariensis TaxID=137265 RepID=A0A1H3RCT2_9ACTN|nr:FadR/GntR family transcriptional regulator [Asanoa ishikariensis]GIF64190.1 GntR family transcriptional regulator [Asanoa ishikariensis]SDZ23125.1 DNA-binding transcriptional regulator, FadR family [Asanoa ishikariensis]
MQQYTARGVHGQTVEVLAQRILTGQLPEGAILDLNALQSEFDVSLTVLREALRVLAAKGLVDARPKRGTFVRPRSAWSLLDGDVLRWQFARSPGPGLFDDLHELRSIVEPGAASLAASRATEADLAALDAALADMAAAGADPLAAVAADLAFHRALLAATHNELIQRMEVVIETGLAERDRMVHGTDGPRDPVPSHKAVVDGIRRHNPAQAARAMRKLLDQAIEDVARLERNHLEDRQD